MNPSTPDTIDSVLQRAKRKNVYWEERAIIDFTEQVIDRMVRCGLSKKELAEKLGVAPAFVTKLLGGTNNYTLKTMVRVSMALDSELRFKLDGVHARRWRNYVARKTKAVAQAVSQSEEVALVSCAAGGNSVPAETNRIIAFTLPGWKSSESNAPVSSAA